MMSSPKETGKTQQDSAAADAVSVHRAFVYGACGPGFGEIYAGARLRGYATLLLFLAFTVWFTWSLVGVMRIFVNQIFDSLSGTAQFALPQLGGPGRRRMGGSDRLVLSGSRSGLHG